MTVLEVNDQAGGEEPYFAVIKFKTTVGVPGSTSTEFVDQRATLDVPTVYPNSGPVPIPTSRRAQSTEDTLDHLATQTNVAEVGMPITGRIIVGLEEDDRGWDPCCGIEGIRQQLGAIAADLETQLVQLESVSWFPALTYVLQEQFEDFVADAPRSLPGQGRTDDLIGVHILINLGASEPYYDEMRQEFDALGVADCDGSYPLTPVQSGLATYVLSVCPGAGARTMTLPFDAGPGHTTYELRVSQSSVAVE